MGSRAVAVVCRDEETAVDRFGVPRGRRGVVHTRTGRAFFPDRADEQVVVDRLASAIGAAGLWDELDTGWLVLDAELLPWSAKAEDLIREHYAPVGAAGAAHLAALQQVAGAAAERGVDVEGLDRRAAERAAMVDGFRAAYERYCWPVRSIDDLHLAPFQLLAVEGQVLATRDHRWQLDVIDRLVAADPTPLLRMTARRFVDLGDDRSVADGTAWWEELTAAGGEGMVVKPLDPMHRGRKGVVQPGIKCRGPEYLRVIYGPEYTAEANLARLRDRGLGRKRSLAFREFALGLEALERFVDRQPLHRVHECVFGVLAMESEPVDPRL
jgi:protein phosphatase